MEVTHLLTRAQNKIAHIEDWTTRELARDASGAGVAPRDQWATQWDAIGAVEASSLSSNKATQNRAIKALDVAATHIMGAHNYHPELSPAEALNDYYGHRAVMEMYSRAIARS